MDKLVQIATIRTGFPTKFGIPRQSGLVPELKGTITQSGLLTTAHSAAIFYI